MRLAGPQAAVAPHSTRGRITLRGLTSGTISVGEAGLRGSCIMIGDQFSAWIPHVGVLSLKIVGILLKSNRMLDLIDKTFGHQCDVQVGDWDRANLKADVALIDGVACVEALAAADRSGARLVLSTSRTRSRPGKGTWCQVGRDRISHHSVGGITAAIADLTAYQPWWAPALTLGPPLQPEVPRDASTVLSLAEHAKFFRPVPSPEVIQPLRCVNLGSTEKPIYHGRGLLPAVLTRDTWVLTPFLFSPKLKREWGLRRLGTQEILSCLDFPDDWAKALTKAGADRQFIKNQPAMACFVAGANRWLDALFDARNEGGNKKEDFIARRKRRKEKAMRKNIKRIRKKPGHTLTLGVQTSMPNGKRR
jgi:hypothetical protein